MEIEYSLLSVVDVKPDKLGEASIASSPQHTWGRKVDRASGRLNRIFT